MSRDAATIGAPKFWIYQGSIGVVDRRLSKAGRLKHLSTVEMLSRIPLVKTERGSEDHKAAVGERVKTFIVERMLKCAGRGVG